jgi:hypothetical protein
MTIRAVDTIYNGHFFRSRLEARWAVFFNALGLAWEYEAETFDVDGVWYLPDFKLQRRGDSVLWIEVKPEHIEDDAKFSAFARAVSDKALLVSGTPHHYVDHWGADYLQDYLQLEFAVGGLLKNNPRARESKARVEIERAAQVALRARFEHGAHG